MDVVRNKNFLKIVSLLFAFAMWTYVIGTADTQLEKVVNVRYILPNNQSIANEDVKEVVFHLNGPRAFIRTIQEKEEYITVDLTKRKRVVKGKVEVKFKSRDISLPFGVKVTKIEPSRIYLDIEQTLTKKVPVKINTLGELPSIQKMVYSKVEPKSVLVKGPFSVVNELAHVETEAVSLNELKGEGSRPLKLALDDGRVSVVDTSEVEYSFHVKPTQANLVLKDIPIKFLTSKIISQAEKRKVSLIVLSEKPGNEELDVSKVQVIAEIPDTAKGRTMVELKASLPTGLQLVEIQPNKIFVYVK